MPERLSVLSPRNPNVWFWATLFLLGAVLPTFYVDD